MLTYKYAAENDFLKARCVNHWYFKNGDGFVALGNEIAKIQADSAAKYQVEGIVLGIRGILKHANLS